MPEALVLVGVSYSHVPQDVAEKIRSLDFSQMKKSAKIVGVYEVYGTPWELVVGISAHDQESLIKAISQYIRPMNELRASITLNLAKP